MVENLHDIFSFSLSGLHIVERDALVEIDRPIALVSLDGQERTLPKHANVDHFSVDDFTVIVFRKNKIPNLHFPTLFFFVLSHVCIIHIGF